MDAVFDVSGPHELVTCKHDGANFLAATSQFGVDEVDDFIFDGVVSERK